MRILDHRLEGARFIPSPNHDERQTPDDLSLIVIHCISLPPGQFGTEGVTQLFTNALNPDEHPYYADIAHLRVSAHLLIRRTGELLQYVPFNRRAWHAGVSCYAGRDVCNDFSIGIELEGDGEHPFDAAQYASLGALCQAIASQNPIKHWVGHSDIAPGRKSDPGPFFDWSQLLKKVAEIDGKVTKNS